MDKGGEKAERGTPAPSGVPSLVILAASVFRLSVEKQTDRQTDKHTNAAEIPTHERVVGVGNKYKNTRHISRTYVYIYV